MQKALQSAQSLECAEFACAQVSTLREAVVELDLSDLQHVVGGGSPNGTWAASADATAASPNGTW